MAEKTWRWRPLLRFQLSWSQLVWRFNVTSREFSPHWMSSEIPKITGFKAFFSFKCKMLHFIEAMIIFRMITNQTIFGTRHKNCEKVSFHSDIRWKNLLICENTIFPTSLDVLKSIKIIWYFFGKEFFSVNISKNPEEEITERQGKTA